MGFGAVLAGLLASSGGGGDTTAAFIGDSYTFGVNSSDNAHRFSSLTAAALGLTELNKGSSGTLLQNSTYQTSAPGVAQGGNGYDRFLADIQGANARQRYFIAYGFNDIRYAGGLGADGSGTSVSMAALGTQYRQMLNALICNGVNPAKITLISTFWMADAGLAAGSPGFVMTTNLGSTAAARTQLIAGRDLVATIATEYGTLYADAYTAMQTAGASIMAADNIHPNDAGHAVLASTVIAAAANNTKPAPTAVAIARAGAGAMTVSWGAPTPPNGRTITNYTVEYGIKSAVLLASRFVMTGTTAAAGTSQGFSSLADGWYVARVRANYDDATSSPWAWFTAGQNVDSRTTDTVVASTDFSTATPGANVESVAGWSKAAISTSSLTIGGAVGSRGFTSPDVMGGLTTSQTCLYSGAAQDFPGSGKLFNEQVWVYRSTGAGNANTSTMLKGNNAAAANGVLALYNDSSFRVFTLNANALAAATGTTTYSVTLIPNLEYLVRLEVSSGAQTIYLNNIAVATATAATGGAWGTEAGFRLANTTFVNTDFTGTHIKSQRVGTTV